MPLPNYQLKTCSYCREFSAYQIAVLLCLQNLTTGQTETNLSPWEKKKLEFPAKSYAGNPHNCLKDEISKARIWPNSRQQNGQTSLIRHTISSTQVTYYRNCNRRRSPVDCRSQGNCCGIVQRSPKKFPDKESMLKSN